MESIQKYLLSIIVSAMISGLLVRFVKKDTAYGSMLRLLASLFVVITVVSPWTNFNFENISFYWKEFDMDASDQVAIGQEFATESLQKIIKEQSESYILDKANALGADLRVNITISQANPPVPVSVQLEGNLSPYAKKQLKQIIAKDLGIPEGEQAWI